jgi:hypothetical protein
MKVVVMRKGTDARAEGLHVHLSDNLVWFT